MYKEGLLDWDECINPECPSQKLSLLERAYSFAKHEHGKVSQVRRYTGRLYIDHPVHVSRILQSITEDPISLAAAVLHDVLEDTKACEIDMRYRFGEDVVRLVQWCTTGVYLGNRAQRMAQERARRAHAPAAAQKSWWRI